jgi:hypothetical protein
MGCRPAVTAGRGGERRGAGALAGGRRRAAAALDPGPFDPAAGRARATCHQDAACGKRDPLSLRPRELLKACALHLTRPSWLRQAALLHDNMTAAADERLLCVRCMHAWGAAAGCCPP